MFILSILYNNTILRTKNISELLVKVVRHKK